MGIEQILELELFGKNKYEELRRIKMKRIILIVMIIVLFASTAVASDIRGNNWGATIDEVASIEQTEAEYVDYTNYENIFIQYKVSLKGKKGVILYLFTREPETLAQGIYLIQFYASIEDRDKYTLSIIETLDKKYGDKIYEKHNPITIEYIAYWKTPTTAIRLSASIGEVGYKVVIQYRDIERFPLEIPADEL